MKLREGGGVDHEKENIEVLEMPFEEALEMVSSGEIKDAKTIDHADSAFEIEGNSLKSRSFTYFKSLKSYLTGWKRSK